MKAGLAKAGAALIGPAAAAEGNAIRLSAQVSVNQKLAVATPPMTDMVLTSHRSFLVGNAFPKVQIGKVTVEDGTISPDGKSLTVSLPTAVMAQLPTGAPVSVTLQKSQPVWQFGGLPKMK